MHPLVPGESKRFGELYRGRGAVERCFSRVKDDYGLAPLRIRRIERVALQADLYGTALDAYARFATAIELLLPGGLLGVRVNPTGTEVEHRYTVNDTNAEGGITVRYDDGSKAGLLVHFFGRAEIEALTANLVTVSLLRRHRSQRLSPRSGHWDQWEGIWSTPVLRTSPVVAS